jgi:hypothetical protein
MRVVRPLRIEGAVLGEAQIVAPRVHDVERSLAPWARDHFAGRLAMHLIWSEHAEPSGTSVDSVDVDDGEGQ